MADQRMTDVVVEAWSRMLEKDLQVAVLGEGDPAIEIGFRMAAQRYPGKAAVHIGYDEPLAHRLLAGADILLHPSRFEPCGLTHRYAIRYGSLPIVRFTGGLAATVVDCHGRTIGAGKAKWVRVRAVARGKKHA